MLTIRRADPESVEDLRLVRMLFEEYILELGVDLGFQGIRQELADPFGKYAAPTGFVLLAFEGREPAACVALRELEPGVGEIKRMFVRPEHRRSGIAKKLWVALLTEVTRHSYDKLKLDTMARLSPALNFYIALGFRFCEPFNESPESDTLYLEYDLV